MATSLIMKQSMVDARLSSLVHSRKHKSKRMKQQSSGRRRTSVLWGAPASRHRHSKTLHRPPVVMTQTLPQQQQQQHQPVMVGGAGGEMTSME